MAAAGGSTYRMPSKHAKGAGAAYVYERLREEILSLALKPGETLDEALLVQRFRLSRTPVREAVIRLAGEGLVTMLPNRGAQVAALDLTDFPRYVEAFDLLQRAVTRLAALRRSDDQLAALETARDAFEAKVGTSRAIVLTELNREFHIAVAEAANNSYLAGPYVRLLDEGMRLLRVPFAYDPEGEENGRQRHLKKIIQEHRAIVEAIRAQDGTRAEELGQAHTELFRKRFLQFLQQNDVERVGVILRR